MSSAIPQDVLNKQICTECANYLSVGPVVVSPEGDIICGRCPTPSKATISLYNLLSENISFRCINYHAGCQQLLQVTETLQHEEVCESKKNFDCPLCYFEGNSCQLFSHFGKLHVNLIVKGGSLEKILSYRHLKNYVDSILNMGKYRLKLFVSGAVKLFSVCTRCKRQFDVNCIIYLCPEYHLQCMNCFKEGCSKCKVPCELNKRTELHYILLECEWHGCCEKKNIFQYVSHKQQCTYRLYKCPSKNCMYVGLLKSFKRHWHLNDLISGSHSFFINFAKYWLNSKSNEIVYVTCHALDSDRYINVVVDENNLISPFSFELKGYGIMNWQYKPLNHIKYSNVRVADGPFDVFDNLTPYTYN